MVIFDYTHLKITESTCSFPEFVLHGKNQFKPCSFLKYSQFQSPMTRQNCFDWLFIFVNLYQHTKNHFISFVHSSDTVNFRVHGIIHGRFAPSPGIFFVPATLSEEKTDPPNPMLTSHNLWKSIRLRNDLPLQSSNSSGGW